MREAEATKSTESKALAALGTEVGTMNAAMAGPMIRMPNMTCWMRRIGGAEAVKRDGGEERMADSLGGREEAGDDADEARMAYKCQVRVAKISRRQSRHDGCCRSQPWWV